VKGFLRNANADVCEGAVHTPSWASDAKGLDGTMPMNFAFLIGRLHTPRQLSESGSHVWKNRRTLP
jgi:hypothetical protein